MSENRSVVSGIGTMAALTISSKLVRLFILMVTARFLTPEDFGVVAAFTMVFGFAYLVADMGILRTVIQRPLISERHIGSALGLSVGLCTLVSITLIFLGTSIADILTIEEIGLPLKVSSLMFLLLGVSNICSALLQRGGNILFIGKVQAFGTITGNVFVTVPLLYFDIGYWAIIIGLWVSELISILFILQKGWGNLRYKIYKKELVEISKYASAFFFNNTLGLLSQQLDIAIVSRFLGSATLGNYSRAMQLVDFPNQIYLLVVDRVVFPVMAAMKSEKDKLVVFFLQSLSLLSLALTLGSILLIVGAHEIVLIMMGSQWGVVGDLLQILASCIIFRALSSFMDSFLAAYDLVKILTIKQVTSLFILLFSVWFGLDYGVIGVAYAVVIASILRFLLTLMFIIMYTRITCYQLINKFSPSLFSAFFIIALYLMISKISILSGLLGGIVTILIFLIFCAIKPLGLFLTDKGAVFIKQKKANL
ncbi:oligosaccharide flippase family protein [Paraglaciecola sp. L1A13]|uniref:oligosaccharide flippase family protein n=1 Tax=Paraglaciecola sp. L1A13 TaxID=2686359 RepID=UPI00131B026B|nr:oligosaccharide flippase family protein [Paraglaciecola sp. L1A13]